MKEVKGILGHHHPGNARQKVQKKLKEVKDNTDRLTDPQAEPARRWNVNWCACGNGQAEKANNPICPRESGK